jgi:aspartyl-tRNA(Asn)/glutamyl-tRNA(Gln) amidotransferase subunit A
MVGHCGPLAGMSVALKEWIAADAVAVVRLRAAGATVVGTTVASAADSVDVPTRNPWDLARTPGWSSSGSAVAVAAGLVPAALGTDTAGSVRIPAALCGVVGFKPSHGAVPLDGVRPVAPTLDALGPIARTVADAGRLFDVLSGADGAGGGPDPATLRVGVPTSYAFDRIEPRVEATVRAAIDLLLEQDLMRVPCRLPMSERFARVTATIATFEHGSADSSRSEYEAALALRRELQAEWSALFAHVDVVAMPTVVAIAAPADAATVAFADGAEPVWSAYPRLCRPASIAGLPALTVPCGQADGLPVGLQIVGPHGADHRVLELGARFERARGPLPRPVVWSSV